MNITDMVTSYAENPRLRGRLKVEFTVDNDTLFKKGLVSDLLIELADGSYHFEALDTACKVQPHEISIF